MIEEQIEYNLDVQKLLVENLLSNPELFARCNKILSHEYFDVALNKPVKFIREYFEEYRTVPNPKTIAATTGFQFDVAETLNKADQDFTAKQIESFCRNSAVWAAVMKAPALHDKGDFGAIWQLIKEADAISLNRDLGINYFDNVGDRLRDLLNNSPTISTGWAEVDEAIGGGINRQELLLLTAASGIGKSICMSNLGINLVEQGYSGVYFSLELADRIVCKRFDSMVTGIGQADILKNISAVESKVENFRGKHDAKLFVKRFPESVTTANDLRAYLKEFQQTYGFTPDFIIVDYLDLMATNRDISNENIWLADKYKAEELRALGLEFDCAVITASQLGRGSLEAEKVGQQHIQGGYSKVQTCDIMIAIIQTDLMRAAGEYQFEYTKVRNASGTGSHTLLKWDPIALRVSNWEEGNQGLRIKPKSETINTVLNTYGSMIADKFNQNGSTSKSNLLDLVGKK